jgi:hypothetical protein
MGRIRGSPHVARHHVRLDLALKGFSVPEVASGIGGVRSDLARHEHD